MRIFHFLFGLALLCLAAWYFLAAGSAPATPGDEPATPPSPSPTIIPHDAPPSQPDGSAETDEVVSPEDHPFPSPLDPLAPPEDEEAFRQLKGQAENHADPAHRREALDRLSPSFLRQDSYDPVLLTLFQNAAQNDEAAVVRKSALRTLCRLSDNLSWEIVRRATESDPDLKGWLQTHLRELHVADAYTEALKTWAPAPLAGSDFKDVADRRIKSLPAPPAPPPSDPPLPKR